ncbi:MAG: hypothetical protein HY741_15275 [Chloroflexi bacterium]|nr:hypothetical protein [Chloroflexota bacterium]
MSETSKLPDITALMARRLRCPVCMRRFRTQDISVIESAPRRGVFCLRCPMCASQRLVIGVWNKNAMRTYVTDLDQEEWTYYRHAPPIHSDDVLRMVRMLRTYDGDFSDVLEDPILGESE